MFNSPAHVASATICVGLPTAIAGSFAACGTILSSTKIFNKDWFKAHAHLPDFVIKEKIQAKQSKKVAQAMVPAFKQVFIPIFFSSVTSVFVAVITNSLWNTNSLSLKDKASMDEQILFIASILSTTAFITTSLYFTTTIITATTLPIFLISSLIFLECQKDNKKNQLDTLRGTFFLATVVSPLGIISLPFAVSLNGVVKWLNKK